MSGIVLDVGQQVARGEIDLVADGERIGGVEPGLVTQGGDDEGAGLGDEAELAVWSPRDFGSLVSGMNMVS